MCIWVGLFIVVTVTSTSLVCELDECVDIIIVYVHLEVEKERNGIKVNISSRIFPNPVQHDEDDRGGKNRAGGDI